jgi:hypothetical protein
MCEQEQFDKYPSRRVIKMTTCNELLLARDQTGKTSNRAEATSDPQLAEEKLLKRKEDSRMLSALLAPILADLRKQ